MNDPRKRGWGDQVTAPLGRLFPSTNPVPPQNLVSQGHAVLNTSFYPTYTYPVPSSPVPATPRAMYENWSVHRFHGFAYTDDHGSGYPFHDLDAADPNNRGAAVHFWSGGSTTWTEEQTTESLFPRLRVMAQKTWESAPLVGSYAEFEPLFRLVGSAPG